MGRSREGSLLFPGHGVKMIKSDRPRRGPGKNLYIWSRSDQRQATNGFVDLFTFHGPGIYGTNVRAAPRM